MDTVVAVAAVEGSNRGIQDHQSTCFDIVLEDTAIEDIAVVVDELVAGNKNQSTATMAELVQLAFDGQKGKKERLMLMEGIVGKVEKRYQFSCVRISFCRL